MRGKRVGWACAVAAMAFFGASALRAAPITGQGDPSDVVKGGSVVNFDSGPTGVFPAPVTIDGATFSGNAPFYIGGGFFMGGYNTRGACALYTGPDEAAATILVIDLSRRVNAFAFLWGASDVWWRITAYDSDGAVIETLDMPPLVGSNAGDYFGIRAKGIKRVVVQSLGGGDWVLMDNFTADADLAARSARAKVLRARGSVIADRPTGDAWQDMLLWKAYRDIQDGLLTTRWLDEDTLDRRKGEAVFDKLASAVKHPKAITEREGADALIQQDAQDAMDDLVAAADQLALTAINAISDQEIPAAAKANEYYANGQALAAEGRVAAAIIEFKKAWQCAQRALGQQPT